MLDGQEEEALPSDEAVEAEAVPAEAPPDSPHMVPPPFFVPPAVMEPEPETEPEEKTYEFPPEFRERFDGLMFVGKLTDEITVAGHKIVIRTLSSDDIMEVGLVTAPWQNTESAVRAYMTGIAGACMVSIDKRGLPMPLSVHPDDSEILNRFNYARGLNPFVVDRVYDEYRALEDRVEQMIAAMGGASG